MVERGQYKQRIVGGLVLVALGAIVIPFLLDMHTADQWWGKSTIQKKPDNGFVTRVLPLEDWANQAQSELAEGVEPPKINGPAPSPAPHDSTLKTAAVPPSSLSAVPAAGEMAPALEGWVVQLGSFSSEKNAEELQERLLRKGYRVFVDQFRQDGNTAYRVRIGPEQQRVTAENISNLIERDLKRKAIVLHIP